MGSNTVLRVVVLLFVSRRMFDQEHAAHTVCTTPPPPPQVIAGSDKGKVGKVTTVITKTGHIVVDGVNIKFKHVKPRAQGESGQILQRESPIHHSNVMLYSESQKVRSRVSYRTKPDGTKVRVLVKTGEELPLSNKPEKKEGGSSESSTEQ